MGWDPWEETKDYVEEKTNQIATQVVSDPLGMITGTYWLNAGMEGYDAIEGAVDLGERTWDKAKEEYDRIEDVITNKEGQEDIEALARTNAEFIIMENIELNRRAKLAHEQQMEFITAVQSSSGFKIDSESFTSYRDELESVFKDEIRWSEFSANSRAEITIRGGQIQADQAGFSSLQSWFQMGSTVASWF